MSKLAVTLHNARKIPRMLVAARTRFDGVYEHIAHVVAMHSDTPPGLTAYEYRVFSQNGEDGILAELFRRIGTTNRFFFEFGVCEGIQGNAVFLADVMGWSGAFMEADGQLFAHLQRKYGTNDRIALLHDAASPQSINAQLSAVGAPTELDLLSIDIDGNDYWVWDAVTDYRPRSVVIEYNGGLPPSEHLVQPYSTTFWEGDAFYGASAGALKLLGKRKGYRLVHTDLTGTNAFFVREDLGGAFDDLEPPVMRSSNQSLMANTHRPARPRPLGGDYLTVD